MKARNEYKSYKKLNKEENRRVKGGSRQNKIKEFKNKCNEIGMRIK
jgi:hypothetical protein